MGHVLEGRLRRADVVTTFVALPALVMLLSWAPSQLGVTVLKGCAHLRARLGVLVN
ncbi:MAG: hypothetical protein ACLQFT_07470 [Steroidobacteraceae bacterium]|jgi:hypothetical protein